MTRTLNLGVAQLGPIARDESRSSAVRRMIELMEQAHQKKVELIVFPELALTTFFPRWYLEDPAELEAFFETEMPNQATQPLFDAAARMGIGFYLGYAELCVENGQRHQFNTTILVDRRGTIIGKYRKIHLPGHSEHEPERPFQHLEKRYFEIGNLGFPVWRFLGGLFGMCICNDRRWPETYRVMGLQGVEMVILGYNTPTTNSQSNEAPHVRAFHNLLSMQAGAYQNSTWVVGVAKAGDEDGHELMGGSAIIAPSGELVAQCLTLDDELAIADCDLDATIFGKQTIFDFGRHRRIEHYGLITQQNGVTLPPD